MASFSVTYRAPEGDSPFVETRGVRFIDGQAVVLEEDEHAELIKAADSNPHFEVEGAKAPPAAKPAVDEAVYPNGPHLRAKERGWFDVYDGDVKINDKAMRRDEADEELAKLMDPPL